MRKLLLVLIGAGLSLPSPAQDTRTSTLTDVAALPQVLNFEDQKSVGPPAGWMGKPEGTVLIDDKIVHGGHWAARLERQSDSPGAFSTLHRAIAMDFAGTTVELRGFLRTEQVSQLAGLWMREDGEAPSLAFDNMANRPVTGTTEWTEYSIKLPVHPEARQLFFGVLLVGSGKLWVDDLQVLVDGKPVASAPKVEHAKTVFDLDKKFDEGSGIKLDTLTEIQIGNLATLGRVWGFLKYHHPAVLAGKLHWDYELLRTVPAILQAHDRTQANAAMLKWIEGLGPVAPCKPCASLSEDDKDIQLRPDVSWLSDETMLGMELSKGLLTIYRNRPADGHQFYLTLAPQVKNPSFKHELSYTLVKFPDSGFQLLALYRFWNIMEYWSPNRAIMGEDWGKVLAEFIPRLALAKTKDDYTLQMMALIGRAHDGHANLWSSLAVRPPTGDCQFPVIVRFIQDQPVVSIIPKDAKESGLAAGDVITEIDGVPVKKLVEDWKPYYDGSNDAAIMRDIGLYMTRGKCGDASASILRDGKPLALKPKRVPISPTSMGFAHDQPGETFRLLSKDVAYLKLSTVKAADAAHYVESATGTKALIIDIRNYPSGFMVFALGQLLVGNETPFARFTVGDLANPGAFHWTEPERLTPGKPHYAGKIAILVDEGSISQSEYTSMAFRASPRAIVVGSTTAGADGNVSPFALPGGLNTMISGIGVFYPDKKPTQRIGILPDFEVRPTIAGIRAGRDEVLEEALRQVLGNSVPAAEIEKMAKPTTGN